MHQAGSTALGAPDYAYDRRSGAGLKPTSGTSTLCSASLTMAPFFDLFDDLCAERFQIARIARSDDPLSDHDFRIFPLATRVNDICFDGFEGRHFAALGNARSVAKEHDR